MHIGRIMKLNRQRFFCPLLYQKCARTMSLSFNFSNKICIITSWVHFNLATIIRNWQKLAEESSMWLKLLNYNFEGICGD